ncbi:MAG: glycosyltransferase family 2 protein [Lachnospiraceae bacterium]
MIVTKNMNKSEEKPLVSIIVAVYKVEKYLDRCVQSIISQTYKNIEVILVDDGSPDNCGKICDEYAEKYPYIHVIHQENRGLATVRNNAVNVSKGDYILFVDSDDYITSDHVDYLVNLLMENDCDISIGGFYYQYEGKDVPRRIYQNNFDIMSAAQAIERMNYGKGYGATAWAKLMPREVVLNYPFPQGKLYYEDLDTMYKIFGDVDKVVFGDRTIYYWVQRDNSITRSEFDDKQLYGLSAANNQIEYVTNKYPQILASAQARYTAKVIELMGIALKSNMSYRNYKLLKKEFKYVLSFLLNKNVRITQKIRCIAVLLGYVPSRIIFSLHEYAKEKLL